MRIGISTSVIQRGKTGVAQYVFALLRAFLPSASKHRFHLFVLEEDVPLFSFCKDAMDIIPVAERHRRPVRNILWHQGALPRLAVSHKLDVVHIPSYRRMLWRRPCALVSTIHDLAPFHVSKKYDWKRMMYAKVFVRRLARRQNEIIAISGNTATVFATFFGISEHVKVVHNGLDHDRFKPGSLEQAKIEARQRYGLQKAFFLYVARLEHPAKNHVRLISAFERFKAQTGSDWQLVFAGSDWHGADVIHAAVRKSPVTADVHSLGFIKDEELPNLYRAADAFVYPSLYEGFGMPPIEAMACGCPVISSTCGSLGEVVGDAAAIVEPEDVKSITGELEAFALNPSVREHFRAAGLTQAARFDWSHTAEQTLQVYQQAFTSA